MLVDYKTRYGDCLVGSSHENKSLFVWVVGQRAKYRERTLAQTDIDLLNDIGMVWDARYHEWLLMLKRLEAFQRDFGHVQVTQSYHDKKLSKWASNQRAFYKAGKLSADRVEMLKKLGFKFEFPETR
jgi:hypothetical protein